MLFSSCFFLFLIFVVDEGSRSGRRADDNPFSFKRFLQPSGSRRTPGSVGSASIATLDLANDLPDFVQDHYHGDREHARLRGGRLQASTDAPLPDFALDTDLGRFHSHADDMHSFSAAAAGRWMPGDADSIPPSDMSFHHDDCSKHRIRSPGASNSAARASQLSDFSVDSWSEGGEVLDRFGLVDRNSTSHEPDCALTPTDGPSIVGANSAGGLPDFLSDSALGVVDICSRNTTTAADAAASNAVHTTRHLTNGFAGPNSESESVLSRVQFLRLFLLILMLKPESLCGNSVNIYYWQIYLASWALRVVSCPIPVSRLAPVAMLPTAQTAGSSAPLPLRPS